MKYVTLEESNTYFSTRIDSDPWDLASDTLKEKTLLHTERVFERLAYRGLAVTEGYIFPRDDGTEVPTAVKEAIYEEALSLLSGKRIEQEISDLHVVSSSSAGFSTALDSLADRPWIGAMITSPVAWGLISPYLLDSRNFRTTAS